MDDRCIASLRSFQDIESLEKSGVLHLPSADWNAMKLAFNKRHLLAHKLGVVDESYQRKSRDYSQAIGSRVIIAKVEVVSAALACQNAIRHFFGYYLS